MSNVHQNPVVSIIMGSDSDLDRMTEAAKMMEFFEVGYEMTVSSAHRSPAAAMQLAETATDRGIEVIIAGAGRAAHLAGVIAAHTILPVIGVPIDGGPLNGVDALYSTVQMPPGIPVATMAIGAGGARNAGILAVQILALKSDELRHRLLEYKDDLAKGVESKTERLSEVGYREYAKS